MARTPTSAGDSVTSSHAHIGLYRRFVDAVRKDPLSGDPAQLLSDLTESCLSHLGKVDRRDVVSRVPEKAYMTFATGTGMSRPVNCALFVPSNDMVDAFLGRLMEHQLADMPPTEITRACYTIAMAFCCTNDLTKKDDQKTPGTFFERLISYLYARTLGVRPATGIEVLNLGMRATLPTDFIFDPGPDRPERARTDPPR